VLELRSSLAVLLYPEGHHHQQLSHRMLRMKTTLLSSQHVTDTGIACGWLDSEGQCIALLGRPALVRPMCGGLSERKIECRRQW